MGWPFMRHAFSTRQCLHGFDLMRDVQAGHPRCAAQLGVGLSRCLGADPCV